MKRYEATGTITIRCYAETEDAARKEIALHAREINAYTGVHISMADHYLVLKNRDGRIKP